MASAKAGAAGRSTRKAAKPPASPAASNGLRERLQLLAGFLVPLVALGLWLRSRGFFESP